MRCREGEVDQTQQHQKNVTEKTDPANKSYYLQNKTRVKYLSIPHPRHINEALLCQPFTVATEHDASIFFFLP